MVKGSAKVQRYHAPRLCGRGGAVASVAGEGAAWRPAKEGARLLAC